MIQKAIRIQTATTTNTDNDLSCPRCRGFLYQEPTEPVGDPDQDKWAPLHCLNCGFITDEVMEENRMRDLSNHKPPDVRRRDIVSSANVLRLRITENLDNVQIAERLGTSPQCIYNVDHRRRERN